MSFQHATPQKALLFDLMGTCCDWLSSLLPLFHCLPTHPSLQPTDTALSQLAADWRAGFFEEIHQRFKAGSGPESIDVTHRKVLNRLLAERGVGEDVWGEKERESAVHQWHEQKAWPDAIAALERLRKKYFLVVLANGTTRLQLDIAKSSGLPFHMLLSSELLGLTKPDPRIYRRALELMQLEPEECTMVAAHAYDLRAAKTVGINTVYVHRTTEDVGEDMETIKADVDIFIEGIDGSMESGLGKLADLFEA